MSIWILLNALSRPKKCRLPLPKMAMDHHPRCGKGAQDEPPRPINISARNLCSLFLRARCSFGCTPSMIPMTLLPTLSSCLMRREIEAHRSRLRETNFPDSAICFNCANVLPGELRIFSATVSPTTRMGAFPLESCGTPPRHPHPRPKRLATDQKRNAPARASQLQTTPTAPL